MLLPIQIGLHSVLLPLSIEQSINQSNPADWARVRYRRNVISLSIDMSADCRTTTLGRHIGRHIGPVSVEISADISVDMSVKMSTDTSRSIYRPIVGRPTYLSSVGMVWYGILYLNQRSTLGPTTLSWFPWRACLYRHKKTLELVIQD